MDFLFSQGRGGRKEFLRNAGLGGLGGLARVFNDSRARIYFLAKAQRTQRNSYGMQDLAAWRETLMIKRDNFCSRKGAENAKESNWIIGLARKITRLT